MLEIYLRFTYSACGPFTKTKEKIHKFKETGDLRYFYLNELDKTFLQHDVAYGDFTDLNRRIDFDKILWDKACNVAENPKYDEYQRKLASMVYKFLIKKLLVEVLKI